MSVNITSWYEQRKATKSGSLTIFSRQFLVMGKADYTNGGTTFNFPVGFYSEMPTINTSISLGTDTYSSGTGYSPIITASSSSSVTIRVNTIQSGSIVESSTGDIKVSISAIGK